MVSTCNLYINRGCRNRQGLTASHVPGGTHAMLTRNGLLPAFFLAATWGNAEPVGEGARNEAGVRAPAAVYCTPSDDVGDPELGEGVRRRRLPGLGMACGGSCRGVEAGVGLPVSGSTLNREESKSTAPAVSFRGWRCHPCSSRRASWFPLRRSPRLFSRQLRARCGRRCPRHSPSPVGPSRPRIARRRSSTAKEGKMP